VKEGGEATGRPVSVVGLGLCRGGGGAMVQMTVAGPDGLHLNNNNKYKCGGSQHS